MKRKDFDNLLFLLKAVYRQEKKTFFIGIVDGILQAIIPYISVIMIGKIIDLVLGKKELSQILWFVTGIILCRFLLQVIEARLEESFHKKIENFPKEFASRDLNKKALTMDYEYLEEARTQDIRFRSFQQSYYGVGGWLMVVSRHFIKNSLSMLIAIFIVAPMFRGATTSKYVFLGSGWFSFIMVFALGGLAFLNYKINVRDTRKAMQKYFDSTIAYNKKMYYLDLLSGVEPQKDIRVMNFEKVVMKDINGLFSAIHKNEKEQNMIYVKRNFLQKTVYGIGNLLIYLCTGLKAYLGVITIGNVVTYASSFNQFMASLNRFSMNVAHWASASMYAADYREFVELGNKKYKGTIPVEKRRDNKFLVEFDHVSFKYPGSEEYTIKDLNLKLTIGEKLAIVGKNGSGKTTFIKLLCRLYDVTEGCIRVNGIDIRKYDYKDYCDLFGVVFQDFRIFAFPLGENVAAGSKVDKDRVVDAITRAGLGDRLEKLEGGLDTCVGKDYDEQGVAFSGGEKQKLAIARAIYKDAPFVIMDEPTAALDPEAEAEVFEGFDKMVGRKTSIYISHRLASCKFCEDILVFDKGQLVQHGSHEDLSKKKGLYRELWNAQAQYYVAT